MSLIPASDARLRCLPSGVKLSNIRRGFAVVNDDGEPIGDVRAMPDDPGFWEAWTYEDRVSQWCDSRTQAVCDLVVWVRSDR